MRGLLPPLHSAACAAAAATAGAGVELKVELGEREGDEGAVGVPGGAARADGLLELAVQPHLVRVRVRVSVRVRARVRVRVRVREMSGSEVNTRHLGGRASQG